MTMTHLEKMTCINIYLHVAVIALLFSMASAKPTNSCTGNQFWVYDKDGSTSCENCPTCPPGQTLSPECGKRIPASAMVTCVPCSHGVSFSSKHDTLSCTPCSSCSKDQVVLKNCTSQLDIKCAKRCYSKDRYYDYDNGDCFVCSRCCGDDQDAVEDECKAKLGAGSNIICSFHSSVNRCEKPTTSPQTPTTITNLTSAANNNTSLASQGSKREHIAPPTTQSTGSLHPSQRKDQDFLAAVSIPGVILVLLVCSGLFYLIKKRQVGTFFGCIRSCDAESGSHDSVTEEQCSLNKKAIEGEAEEALTKNIFYKLGTISPESMEPLLQQGVPPLLTCSCEIAREEEPQSHRITPENSTAVEPRSHPITLEDSTAVEPQSHPITLEDPTAVEPQSRPITLEDPTAHGSQETLSYDSKLLCSLLQHESDDVQKIYNRLDTKMPGLGHYRAVALHYSCDHFQIASRFEKHDEGPTRALIEWLAATKPNLTVREFITVVRNKSKRNDIAELLEKYDEN